MSTYDTTEADKRIEAGLKELSLRHRHEANRPKFRQGFSGSRHGMDHTQKTDFEMIIRTFPPDEFHHGSCMGADVEAARMVRDIVPDCWIVAHPGPAGNKYLEVSGVDNETRPNKPFLARNIDIVNETGSLIAAPKNSDPDSGGGTWFTINYADGINRVPIVIHRKQRLNVPAITPQEPR